MYEFDSCTTKQIEIIQSQYLFSFQMYRMIKNTISSKTDRSK